MTTYDKMKNLEKAVLQKEIAFYSNLLTQHAKLLKTHSAFKRASLISNLQASKNTDVKIIKTNTHYNANLKFVSKNITNGKPQSSSTVQNINFPNKTVLINKSSAYKAPVLAKSSNKLHGNFEGKNVLSWTSSQKSFNKYSRNTSSKLLNFKKASLSLSNVPKSQYQKITSSNCTGTFVTKTTESILKKDEKVPSDKESCHKNTLYRQQLLIGEILATTKQLKQTSKTLTSSKIPSLPPIRKEELKRINDIMYNQSLKSTAKPVIFPDTNVNEILKSIPETNNNSSMAFQATSKSTSNGENNMQSAAVPIVKPFPKKQLEDTPKVSSKHLKRSNAQFVCTPAKKLAKSVCISSKKKHLVTKASPSKYQVVNKHFLFNQTNTSGMPNYSNLNRSKYKHHKWTCQKDLKQNTFVNKQNQVNSKYKVVNKMMDDTDNLKSINPFKVLPVKKLKYNKHIFLKKRNSSSESLNESKASKLMKRTVLLPFNSNPNTVIHKPFIKSHSKFNSCSKQNLKSPKLSKRQKIQSLKSAAKSKYKVVYKSSTSTPIIATNQNRSLKKSKLNFNKLYNFVKSDIDVDLLMELAAEKKSKSTPNKCVLHKNVYKSKNTIINKNICSVQVKTAKMIKSKYFTANKKHSWQKATASNSFSNHKRYQGGWNKYFQNKNIAPLYHRKNTRNRFKFGANNYSNTSFSLRRSSKRLLYPQNKYTLGSTHANKYFRRIAVNHKIKKASAVKQSMPVSKMLAGRVLQHSINRVLTASLKKKTSKVNTYCMFYNRFGRCNNGTKCPYIHDPSKIAICTRFLRGTCKVKNCSFSHEKCPGKMAICSFYLSGSCTKTDCPYRHEMLSQNSELCKAFVKGYCPEGKQCKKAHILVCPQYVQGFCSKGNECAFPHPPPKEKKISTKKANEKVKLPSDTDEFLMEKVSRYFQPLSEDLTSSDSVVPKRKNLPEQPSFISLSSSSC